MFQMPELIDMHAKDLFGVYLDNYIEAAITLDVIYIFLYNSYFPKVAFGLVYLMEKNQKYL